MILRSNRPLTSLPAPRRMTADLPVRQRLELAKLESTSKEITLPTAANNVAARRLELSRMPPDLSSPRRIGELVPEVIARLMFLTGHILDKPHS